MHRIITSVVMLAACVLAAIPARADEPEQPGWAEPMRRVHSRFTGEAGTLALFGDSISVSLAFWAPLQHGPKEPTDAMAAALKRVQAHQKEPCWRQWRGPAFGNQGGMTIRWAHANADDWLEKLNPEAAVLMFGTNDLTQLDRAEYEQKTREVVQRCLANGTVVMLTTIPPRHGLEEKASRFAEAVRKIAGELKVPLIDYHAEILRRRPDDWDGALPRFRPTAPDQSVYDVPTLIARDGVHPSNPKAHQDYSDASLSRNGYALRNHLTVIRYAEVIEHALRPQ